MVSSIFKTAVKKLFQSTAVITFEANTENASDKSATPSNSDFIKINFSVAPGPVIKMCFAEASFFMLEKKRTASSRKFIFSSDRVAQAPCFQIAAPVVALCETMNPFVEVIAIAIRSIRRESVVDIFNIKCSTVTIP
jgi:hypothetical protein